MRSVARTALIVEMYVLLGPLSLALIFALLPSVAMGFPHAFRLLADPLLRQDPEMTAVIVAVPLAVIAAWMAWGLGIATVRDERYRFGARYWMALGCSMLAAGIAARFVSELVLLAMAPLWLFVAHTTALQRRLRSSTRYAS
jgi:hypothetical protein